MTKTNVMRLLDQAKIPYRTASYDYDENDLNGMHAAEGIGLLKQCSLHPRTAQEICRSHSCWTASDDSCLSAYRNR